MPLVEAKLAQAGRSEEEMRRYKGKLHDHCRRKEPVLYFYFSFEKEKQPVNKGTHICVHNSIDLVRSTKSWMYFTGG